MSHKIKRQLRELKKTNIQTKQNHKHRDELLSNVLAGNCVRIRKACLSESQNVDFVSPTLRVAYAMQPICFYFIVGLTTLPATLQGHFYYGCFEVYHAVWCGMQVVSLS